MHTDPTKEHQWLQQLVGEWTFESKALTGPDQPPETSQGSEKVRPLGGLWVLCEGHGEMPGGGVATMLMTLGYDTRTKRYLGTWIGSMMTHLWLYDGSLDAAGKVLTLHSEGPSFTEEGKLAEYHDVIEIKSPDQRVMTSHALGQDGQWRQFMEANYRRTR